MNEKEGMRLQVSRRVGQVSFYTRSNDTGLEVPRFCCLLAMPRINLSAASCVCAPSDARPALFNGYQRRRGSR